VKSVLVDTTVWVDHFRHRNAALAALLELDLVMVHPLVVGEIACGTPPRRLQTLSDLNALRHVPQASMPEVLAFIERERLHGTGCGVVDLLLLASTLLSPGTELWTLDKRLCAMAQRFGVMHKPLAH